MAVLSFIEGVPVVVLGGALGSGMLSVVFQRAGVFVCEVADVGFIEDRREVLCLRKVRADHLWRAVVSGEVDTVSVLIDGDLVQMEPLIEDRRFALELDSLSFFSRGMYPVPGRVAAFTHVFNEGPMLELWCRHHGRLVGMENLFVIDHGSYEGIEVMLPPGVQRLRIPRGPVDNRQMSEFCGWFQRFLLSSYRWVLHADADELVFLRSGGDFLSWIDGLAPRSTLRPELAIEVVHRPEEERMDFGRCVSEQRGRFVRNRNFSKPVLSNVPTAWTPGFHDCLNPSQESEQLCLAHIKHADSQMYVRRAETWRAAPQTVRDALIFPVATSRVYGVNTEMEFFEMVQGMDSASGEDVPDWMRGRF